MTLNKLLEFVSTLFECKDESGPVQIKARLVWRDEDGCIQKVRMAEFGYCSGLRNALTIEMNTETNEGLHPEDLAAIG